MFLIVVLASVLSVVQAASLGSNFSTNIVGGAIAFPHSFPFAAFLNFDYGQCNGILISSKYILTSAICSTMFLNDGYAVLGAQDLSIYEDTQVAVDIKSKIVHPGFINDPYGIVECNIALMELEEDVEFTNAIQPASLSTSYESYVGQTGQTCGWGFTDLGTGLSDVLQTYENEVISFEECRDKSEQAVVYSICLTDENEKRLGAYDDGAPLVINGVVVGVSSQPRYSVGVFTRISLFLDWIMIHSNI